MYRPERLFGFIQPDEGGPHVFFHWRSIIEDSLGRRLAQVGFSVEFDVETEDARAHTRASYVRVLWDDLEDPSTYTEESVLTRWFHNTGTGIARRPDGGTVAVSAADVVTEGEETLGIGSRILHGVRPPEMGQRFWNATAIEIFLPQSVACADDNAPIEFAAEVWPPPNTKPIERNVIVIPTSSPLLSDRFKNKRLRDIKIRRAS